MKEAIALGSGLFSCLSPRQIARAEGCPGPSALYEKEEKKKLLIIYNIVKHFTGRKAYDSSTMRASL